MLNVEKYVEHDNQFYPTPESFLEQIENDFYEDMSKEEKEIVNEFSGSEEAYNKIFNNQQNYIVEGEELLQIAQ